MTGTPNKPQKDQNSTQNQGKASEKNQGGSSNVQNRENDASTRDRNETKRSGNY